MDEKNLLDLIRQSAAGLTPPESLNPDAIEKLLPQDSRKKKKISTLYRLAGAAAVFVLCAVSLRQIQKIQNYSSQLKQEMPEQLLPQDTENLAGPDASQDEEKIAGPDASALSPAQSYEEIYNALYNEFYYPNDAVDEAFDTGITYMAASGTSERVSGSFEEDGAAPEAVSADELSVPGEVFEEDSAGYSSTNIQESGVDEADIVKTDGQYIYILRQNGSVAIVSVMDPQNPEQVSVIPSAGPELTAVEEMYVDGDILNVIASRQSTSLEQNEDVYYTDSRQETVLYTYDISDRASPRLAGAAAQDGTYETSRKNGSFIYLFTSYYPELEAAYEDSQIIPKVNGTALAASDFYLPQCLTSSSYLLISSVNAEKPSEILDKKALVSGTSNFYVSPENIYIANQNWKSETTATEIMKFHYENGTIAGTAAGTVKGYLNNSFSLNEYDGYLRVVSTYYDDDYNERNGLYIFDGSLRITGSIENLALNETIRSARFFGNIGYFVTFRQTDPLFCVDLSDPAAPAVLSELKVSGFSSYLHFYGENLLLGMGYEADEDTGGTTGIKLSMFDISDPANVTELHRFVIPGVTWCPSFEDYKSILIDPQKNLFGFFCSERYLVFSYDKEQGFVSELVYDFIGDSISEQAQNTQEDIMTAPGKDEPAASYDNTRGLYVGDSFYLAGNSMVITFDMTDRFHKTGRLQLSSS